MNNNNIQKFTSREFGEIKVIMIDGEPYFPATECAKILGYTNPRKAIIDHCRGVTKRDVGVETGKKADGTPAYQIIQVNFIPESDLYRLITHSKLPSAVKFEKFIFETVLPSIRKHGAYISEETLDEMVRNPKFAKNLYRILKTEISKNNALSKFVDEIEPKAYFCDVVLQSETLIPVSIIAKDYGMTAIRFNKLLHDLKIQYKVGDTWLLYKEYDNNGYTKTRTFPISDTETSVHTYWTQFGRKFLFDFLKFYGIMPFENNAKAVAATENNY